MVDDPIPAGFITLPEALQRIAACVSEAHVESAKLELQAKARALAQAKLGGQQRATTTSETPKSGSDREQCEGPSRDALSNWEKGNFAATKLLLALQSGAILAMVRCPEPGELFRLLPADWHLPRTDHSWRCHSDLRQQRICLPPWKNGSP